MLKEKSETVKVVVRCRPLSQKEITEHHDCVVDVNMGAHTISVNNPNNIKDVKNFTFDYTYDKGAAQAQIFRETALPILESVMEGYNGTIFAYGQTGTGKTYTMEGVDTEEEKGIIPRTIDWIFDNIKNYANQQFLVTCTFVEIYNEEVRDLLSRNTKAKLNVREKDKVFYLENVTSYQAENSKRMLDIMKAGTVNRAVGATKMNPGSSRSHSIFSIIVEASQADEQGKNHYRVGKLNLVDLAGSERQSKTESTGERFKEATKINLSLTILGSVINKLVSGKSQYIPYRDSKLTMLLQDSLGGNTKTVMIANVGPADYNFDETLNTLWYASHAKKIKNKPRINEDPKDALLRQYQEEIELMKKKLLAMGKGDLVFKITGSKGGAGTSIVNEENQIKQALENLEKEKEEFKRGRESEIQKIKEQKNLAEEEKQKLIDQINKEVEENKRQKDESKKLFNEYQKKKKAVLKGEENEKIVKKQEQEMSKQREELEIKRRAEERLQEELEERSKMNIELKKKYDSKQSHIEDLDKKIAELKFQIESVKKKNKENERIYQDEEANLNEEINSFNVENKRYDFILNKFVPAEEREKIEKCLEYDDKENSYKLNTKMAILQNYKENFPKLKAMQKGKLNNSKIPAIVEEPISLQLEEPDYYCQEELEEKNLDFFRHIVDEIGHIKTDDDSDLVYYNQRLEMIVSGVDSDVVGLEARKIKAKKK